MVWIKNVCLETGYEELSPSNFITNTAMFALEVENGEIKTISKEIPENSTNTIDAKGYLALPS
ncbi:MAG: amidohydrolase, partial [Carnobacterium sp.]